MLRVKRDGKVLHAETSNISIVNYAIYNIRAKMKNSTKCNKIITLSQLVCQHSVRSQRWSSTNLMCKQQHSMCTWCLPKHDFSNNLQVHLNNLVGNFSCGSKSLKYYLKFWMSQLSTATKKKKKKKRKYWIFYCISVCSWNQSREIWHKYLNIAKWL